MGHDRTFAQTSDTPTPFAWFNNPAMTAEEMTAAYGDAAKAFTGAIKAQTEKPLWGILVLNPDVPPTPVPTAVPAAALPAAAQAVSVEAPAEDVVEAEAATLAEDPAPVTAGNSAKATANDSGGNSGGHARSARGGRG